MRKNYIIIHKLTAILLFLSLHSCKEKKSTDINASLFVNQEELAAKSVKIGQDLTPIDIICTSNFLLVQDVNSNDQDWFYCFDLKSRELLYTLFPKGTEHNEFIAPAIVQNPKGDTIKIIDQFSFKICDYALTKDSAYCITSDKLNTENNGPLQEMYLHNDSILLFYDLDNRIITYNLDKKNTIDEFSFSSDLEEKLGSNYNPVYDSFHIGYYGGMVAVGFHFANKLIRGYIDANNHIIMDSDHVDIDISSPKNVMDNNIYYTYIDIDKYVIYTQYAGFQYEEFGIALSNNGKDYRSPLFEVYDKNLSPIALYRPDKRFLRCKYSRRHRRFYIINPTTETKELFYYEMPQ